MESTKEYIAGGARVDRGKIKFDFAWDDPEDDVILLKDLALKKNIKKSFNLLFYLILTNKVFFVTI